MVVGFNEAKMLEVCLESVAFCDEIFYTDLGSTDNSLQIAERYTKNILHRDRSQVPSCEMVQTEVVHLTKNDWVIFIDPDERVDESLAQEIAGRFQEFRNNEKLGAVVVPWQFYFKRKKLKGTIWGGVNSKYFLVNKRRFKFEPIIHYGRKLISGYSSIEMENKGRNNLLHHYWMNSYKDFIRKHMRYLKNEGMDQYNNGRRVKQKEAFLKPITAFKECFIYKKGYKDGAIGLFLSFFWAFYSTRIAFDILKLQNLSKS
jgi:glycosyltransferase involved in cell wall biosynthesis